MNKLTRILEDEVMGSVEEARDYDTMDHSTVNSAFVTEMLDAGWPEPAAAASDVAPPEEEPSEELSVLDLGTGTAQIPIELCRRVDCRVMAVDLAVSMLDLARYNVESASLIDRIQLAQVDAKQLPYDDGQFDVVMSNSIVHHIPEPQSVFGEASRVTRRGGRLFFRDLMRPEDQQTMEQLVEQYAGQENQHQRQMFADSLAAALDLEEIRELVQQLGYSPESVQASSDRHWTWIAERP